MRPGRIVAALVAVTTANALVALPAQAATRDVTVTDNAYQEKVVSIDPGDSVRWTAARAGHTVTAFDGRFDFHPGRTLELGEQVSWTFQEEEEVPYFCRVHSGMEGLIRVGDPPVEPVPPGSRLTVPDQVGSIAAAAAEAAPGTEILIQPGIYREEITVDTDRLTLRGLGKEPGDVVIDGGHQRDVGITVRGRAVHLENLAVRRHRDAGVRIDGASGTVLTDVHVAVNDLYGIDAVGAAGVLLRGVAATDHAIAGIAVRDCAACGARIEQTTLKRNAVGLLASAATGMVVRDSQLGANGAGIVLRDAAAATISSNVLNRNAATDVRTASLFTTLPLWTGAGVWISGGRAHRVHGNDFAGHTYNVAVTGPRPALDIRIQDNVVEDAIHADLGWDGIGSDVCFGGNRRPDGAEVTSDPPAAQQLYDCTLPVTLGVPSPIVDARLMAHALRLGDSFFHVGGNVG